MYIYVFIYIYTYALTHLSCDFTLSHFEFSIYDQYHFARTIFTQIHTNTYQFHDNQALIRADVRACGINISVSIQRYMYLYLHVLLYLYLLINGYIYTCKYVCIYTCVYIYIHMYT